MTSPNQAPNYDEYSTEPGTHAELIALLHRIGKRPLDKLVELKAAIVEQGNSPELADRLVDEPDPAAVYI